jgi:hypothetical protein
MGIIEVILWIGLLAVMSPLLIRFLLHNIICLSRCNACRVCSDDE